MVRPTLCVMLGADQTCPGKASNILTGLQYLQVPGAGRRWQLRSLPSAWLQPLSCGQIRSLLIKHQSVACQPRAQLMWYKAALSPLNLALNILATWCRAEMAASVLAQRLAPASIMRSAALAALSDCCLRCAALVFGASLGPASSCHN